MTDICVRSWTRSSPQDQREGLLGWVAIQFGPLLIDGIAVRRSSDARVILSFPSRLSKSGKKHAIVRPLDDATRKVVETEILQQLARREDARTEVLDG